MIAETKTTTLFDLNNLSLKDLKDYLGIACINYPTNTVPEVEKFLNQLQDGMELFVDYAINIKPLVRSIIKSTVPNEYSMFFYALHIGIDKDTKEKFIVITTDFFTLLITKKSYLVFNKTRKEWNNSDKILSIEGSNFICALYGCYDVNTNNQFYMNAINYRFYTVYSYSSAEAILHNVEPTSLDNYYEFFGNVFNTDSIISKSLFSAFHNGNEITCFCDKFGHADLAKPGISREFTLDGFSLGVRTKLTMNDINVFLVIRGEVKVNSYDKKLTHSAFDDKSPICLVVPEFNIRVTAQNEKGEEVSFAMLREKMGSYANKDSKFVAGVEDFITLNDYIKNGNYLTISNGATYASIFSQEVSNPNDIMNNIFYRKPTDFINLVTGSDIKVFSTSSIVLKQNTEWKLTLKPDNKEKEEYNLIVPVNNCEAIFRNRMPVLVATKIVDYKDISIQGVCFDSNVVTIENKKDFVALDYIVNIKKSPKNGWKHLIKVVFKSDTKNLKNYYMELNNDKLDIHIKSDTIEDDYTGKGMYTVEFEV